MFFIHLTETLFVSRSLLRKFPGMLLLHLLDDTVGKRLAQGCRPFARNEHHYLFEHGLYSVALSLPLFFELGTILLSTLAGNTSVLYGSEHLLGFRILFAP